MSYFPKYADERGVNPMLVAAGAGSYEACRLMLEHGGRASANLADLRGLTPLSYAVRGPRASPALTLLLRRCGGHLVANDVPSARAREMNATAASGRLQCLHLLVLAGFSPEVCLCLICPTSMRNYELSHEDLSSISTWPYKVKMRIRSFKVIG